MSKSRFRLTSTTTIHIVGRRVHLHPPITRHQMYHVSTTYIQYVRAMEGGGYLEVRKSKVKRNSKEQSEVSVIGELKIPVEDPVV
jgi:hypothetical protein